MNKEKFILLYIKSKLTIEKMNKKVLLPSSRLIIDSHLG